MAVLSAIGYVRIHEAVIEMSCSISRGFGVHVSKVRSITLDAWEPELLKVFSELGNDVVNRIYLVNVPEDVAMATPDCNRYVHICCIVT